ncbi:LmeA family phospholipid-binding protein [Streptomyces sp. NPDC058642]|uniref:LmeA family phospholipid-binding protein n=1 Tax=Streptomyces sp. NPDC058642 TaxID=3346572 RepID=UPI00365B0815
MDAPRRPEVHVRGFPVLTQVASGSLRQVDIPFTTYRPTVSPEPERLSSRQPRALNTPAQARS